MAFIELDVPFVSQNDIGGHTGHISHSEQNGCWYASTCMIGYFWEVGPRLGVPAQYPSGDPSKVLPMGARYPDLKKNEQFDGVPLPAEKAWGIWTLYTVLRFLGPCYVRRGFRNKTTGKLTGGHAIVLVGAHTGDSKVAVLDPWETTRAKGRKVFDLATFNDFFKWTEPTQGTSLMYKKRSTPSGPYIQSKLLPKWL